MKHILIAIICFAIISCSDDDSGTNPDISETESFEFPLALGNEWTYGIYDLDERYNIKEEVLYSYKSTIINRLEYKGKTAYEVDEDTRLSYKYYSVDENAIYGHVDYENLSSDGRNLYPEYWVKIYDFTKNNWIVYSKEIKVEDGDYRAEGTVVVSGEKIGKKTTLIDEQEVDIYEFRMIGEIKSTESFAGQVWNEESIDTILVSIADGIGVYSIIENEYELDEEYPDFGWAEQVMDYKLNGE